MIMISKNLGIIIGISIVVVVSITGAVLLGYKQEIKEGANVSIEIVPIPEMSFFDGHIVLPVNKTVEFTGNYNKGGPNGSLIDVFILQDNNTVKWNHLFFDKQLEILPGEYVNVKGKVLKNDVYGYAQLIQVENWTKKDIKIPQEILEKCKYTIKFNSKNLSEQSLYDIAKWNKESLKGYVLDENYLLNLNISQSFIDFENQKIIISFEGTRIPPIEDILYRTAYIYCIFDMKNQNVEKLILTIQGEIQE